MIEKFEDFWVALINTKQSNKTDESVHIKVADFPIKENMFCSICKDYRRHEIKPLYLNANYTETYFDQMRLHYRQIGSYSKERMLDMTRAMLSPSMWNCQCLQCNGVSHIVIYTGPRGQDFLILPSGYGGLSTPNTPTNVSYYLDQANRSHIMGANSAAMAMYRAAIEHILVGQEYKQRMLGNKIQALIKDIENNKAPSWAYSIDTEFLTYIKKLGDSAIHANDGDVEQQIHLDNELIIGVKVVISFLLHEIYEATHQRNSLLNRLKDTLSKMQS